ncbi:MAG: hypothetical protein DMF50_07755 [Acidobacteria bacterium]|nr:MAG: hypothetical protein DMF50_07755 [Acidobacteriota bacterium]
MTHGMTRTPAPAGTTAALILAFPLLCALAASATPAQEILPFSEIKPGMKGIGRTVFSGTRVDEFQVEVLGTLQNVAPKRNLILVRLTGGPLATTGVLDGMSGSPVYINNRLAGAVAYTWGFAKEPVAGVTPIQEMLAVEDKEQPAHAAAARASFPLPSGGAAGLALLRDPERIPAYFTSYFDRLTPGTAASAPIAPIRTPLLFTGFPASVVESLGPALSRAGLVAVQGGSTGKQGAPSDASIVPGAGVGMKLIRGDVEVAAICTVTYREKDRVMACGHPLLNLGPTDLILPAGVVQVRFLGRGGGGLPAGPGHRGLRLSGEEAAPHPGAARPAAGEGPAAALRLRHRRGSLPRPLSSLCGPERRAQQRGEGLRRGGPELQGGIDDQGGGRGGDRAQEPVLGRAGDPVYLRHRGLPGPGPPQQRVPPGARRRDQPDPGLLGRAPHGAPGAGLAEQGPRPRRRDGRAVGGHQAVPRPGGDASHRHRGPRRGAAGPAAPAGRRRRGAGARRGGGGRRLQPARPQAAHLAHQPHPQQRQGLRRPHAQRQRHRLPGREASQSSSLDRPGDGAPADPRQLPPARVPGCGRGDHRHTLHAHRLQTALHRRGGMTCPAPLPVPHGSWEPPSL